MRKNEMTTLYINDNILKVHRVLDVGDKSFCYASDDGIASIAYSEETVKKLAQFKLMFILDVPAGEKPSPGVAMIPHPDHSPHRNWYVPSYWKREIAFYDVEFKNGDDYGYKNKLTAAKLEQGFIEGVKFTRIFSETGLTSDFLTKHNLRIMTKGTLRYAAPMKKKT